MRLPLLLLSTLLSLAACRTGSKSESDEVADSVKYVQEDLQPLGYDLSKPTATFALPDDLREISGITHYRDGLLAAVQDERGDLFLIDSKTGKVRERRLFGDDGDYEDLAFADGEFYALRSDGTVFVFTYDQTFAPGSMIISGERSTKALKMGVPDGSDVEGLGYDKKTNRLLLAIKDIQNAKEPDKRYVFFYDFGRKASWEGIVLSPLKLRVEARLTGKAAEFHPSAIAVHPKTDHVFILAAKGHKLLRLDRMGIIRSVVELDAKQFPQPEGLCFSPEGTLFISSEGEKGKRAGSLMAFAPEPADGVQ
jgi:uncharacterized protein YjiK